jgi:hypothetical protein
LAGFALGSFIYFCFWVCSNGFCCNLDGEVVVKQHDSEDVKVLKRAYNRSLDKLVGGSLRNMVTPSRAHTVRVCTALKQLTPIIRQNKPGKITEGYIEKVAQEIANLKMTPTENYFTFIFLSRGKDASTQVYLEDGMCEDIPERLDQATPWIPSMQTLGSYGDNNYKICRRSIVYDNMECQLALNAYCNRNTCK